MRDERSLTANKRHAAIAARQHGLIRARQLELSRAGVKRRVENGTLYPKYRGVYAYGHQRLSQKGEWLAAVFAAGDGAALTSLSAAAFRGISRFKEKQIDVVTPKQRRPQHGFRAMRSSTLLSTDVVVRDAIPVATIARLLLDVTDHLRAEQAANLIHQAAYLRVFDLAATRDIIARNPGRRTSVLAQAIELHLAGSAGTRSHLEDRFLKLARGANLPEPVINTPQLDIEVDFRWGRLCVEVDGPGHERPAAKAEDRAKKAFLEAQGFTVVRFTDVVIDHRPEEALRGLRDAWPRR